MFSKYLSFFILSIVLFSTPSFAQDQNEFVKFLEPTEYINADHPSISAKAKELTQNCHTDIEKVQALFEFVRDSYTLVEHNSFIASEVLQLGGLSCNRRSVLLAALSRAAGIPSRLMYQSMLLKDFTFGGVKDDHLFIHGIVSLYVDGDWYLYEVVGNNAKWKIWIQEDELEQDMTVQFKAHQDCLFPLSTEKVVLKTLPIYFNDHEEGRYGFMMKIARGETGFIYED